MHMQNGNSRQETFPFNGRPGGDVKVKECRQGRTSSNQVVPMCTVGLGLEADKFRDIRNAQHSCLASEIPRNRSQVDASNENARGSMDREALTAREGITRDSPISPSWLEGLPNSDVANLEAVFGHEMAHNTVTNYRVQWNNFNEWALVKRVATLPADPAQVSAYLAERLQEHGHRPATLRVAASAIAFVHRNAGLEDPCSSPEVKKVLRCATRKAGKHQKQAEALTAEAMSAIESTACQPRMGRGGRLENQETARRRGQLDIALISLMRDAMLRVSETAALTWRDIVVEADGTGRLLIRSSKTDAEGYGAVSFLSAKTITALSSIRRGATLADSIFGLRPNQIADHIKKAAQAAGLGEGYSGHSPRVGMARDLARAGIELPSLMNAGRWQSPTMPAHYTRNETAGRGAVAQFHGYGRRSEQ